MSYLLGTGCLYIQVHSDTGSHWRDLYRYHHSDRVHWHTRPHLRNKKQKQNSNDILLTLSNVQTLTVLDGSPAMPFRQFQSSSDWLWPLLVLSKKIVHLSTKLIRSRAQVYKQNNHCSFQCLTSHCLSRSISSLNWPLLYASSRSIFGISVCSVFQIFHA